MADPIPDLDIHKLREVPQLDVKDEVLKSAKSVFSRFANLALAATGEEMALLPASQGSLQVLISSEDPEKMQVFPVMEKKGQGDRNVVSKTGILYLLDEDRDMAQTRPRTNRLKSTTPLNTELGTDLMIDELGYAPVHIVNLAKLEVDEARALITKMQSKLESSPSASTVLPAAQKLSNLQNEQAAMSTGRFTAIRKP